jgi:hypothetical protein
MPCGSAQAYTSSGNTAVSPHVLQQAMASDDGMHLYDADKNSGFGLSGGFFSGRASGVDPVATNYLTDIAAGSFSLDNTAELEGDQRVYALLIDGSYDFNYDFGSGLPLHPYVQGGMGMAMVDHPGASSNGMQALQGNDMVPLFRLGGGVTYRLGEQWNLSLDYKAGFSGATGGDQFFTDRSQQQPVDLHILNMGMHYKF